MPRTRKVPAHVPPETTLEAREDGWSNVSSGIGILGKDKRLGGKFDLNLVTQEDAEFIWRGDDIAARCVETLPDEMLREGFGFTAEDDKDAVEAVDEAHRDLGTLEVLRTALRFDRAFGGGGILIGADDGQTNWELPLKEDRIKSLKWMTVYSPRELQPVSYYSDPLAPRYGDIAVYRLVPLYNPPGAMPGNIQVHESRVIRFNGIETTRRAMLTNIQPGWGDSIFTRIGQIIQDFQNAWAGAGIILQDFSVATLKIKGLAKVIASAKDDTSIAKRASMIELCRSIARVVIVDADGEEYKRETTTVAGLGDLLDKMALRMAAAASMPVSLLMGQSPAGLNATGDADIRWFYDQIAAMQRRKITPALKRLTKLMFLAKDGPTKGVEPENWDVRYPALWQLTELEKVDVHLKQAQADALMVTNQVTTPEEIGESRYGGDAYSIDTHIDMELRAKLAKQPDQQLERLQPPAPEIDPDATPPGAPKNAKPSGKPGTPSPGLK